jgi:hypothetical protein
VKTIQIAGHLDRPPSDTATDPPQRTQLALLRSPRHNHMRILSDRWNKKISSTDGYLVVNKLISTVMGPFFQNHNPKSTAGEFVG